MIDEGRSIVMEAEVQGSPYLFVNIYAPNIEDCVANKELKIILGRNQEELEMLQMEYDSIYEQITKVS